MILNFYSIVQRAIDLKIVFSLCCIFLNITVEACARYKRREALRVYLKRYFIGPQPATNIL